MTSNRADRARFLEFVADSLPKSFSQRFQDLFALWGSGFKRDGYFVEFGVMNGRDFSNTYLLEKLGWTGVVCEPHPGFAEMVPKVRSCTFSTKCIFDASDQTVTLKTVRGRPALTVIEGFGEDDIHREHRENFIPVEVATISLNDLLDESGAPDVVDFLSIDTQGSELQILAAYDFERRPINLIAVQHNDVHRAALNELLRGRGYTRVCADLSGFDDWYLREDSYPDWSGAALSEMGAVLGGLEEFDIMYADRVSLLEAFLPSGVKVAPLSMVETEAAQAESAQAESAQPESAQAESAQAESAQADSVHAEVQAESDQPDLGVDEAPAVPAGQPVRRTKTKPAPPNPREFSKRPQDRKYLFAHNFANALADASLGTAEVSRRVQRAFRELATEIEPTLVFEIGAFEASFAKLMKATTDARVVAFEANPFVYDRFKADVLASGVDYRHVAVSNESGSISMNLPKDYRGGERPLDSQMGSILANHYSEDHLVVEVPAISLDEEFPDTGNERVVAWIDVEGACEQVLSGSRNVLKDAWAVFIEVERFPLWEGQWLDVHVAEFFDDLGFTMILKDHQAWNQFNLVFVRGDLAAHPWVAHLTADVYRTRAHSGVTPTKPALDQLQTKRQATLARVAEPAPESATAAEPAPDPDSNSVAQDAAALAARIKVGVERRVRDRIGRRFQ